MSVYDDLGFVWKGAVAQRLMDAGFVFKPSYTIKELVEDRGLRTILQDGMYAVYRYLYRNHIQRMDEISTTESDMILIMREMVATVWFEVKQMYDRKDRESAILFDPSKVHVETRVLLNLDDIAAGRTFQAVWQDPTITPGSGGGRGGPILGGG